MDDGRLWAARTSLLEVVACCLVGTPLCVAPPAVSPVTVENKRVPAHMFLTLVDLEFGGPLSVLSMKYFSSVFCQKHGGGC